MTLPIRSLKLDQRWECCGCGVCCRGSMIPLDGDELERLGQQGWDKHPDYRSTRVVVGKGLWKKRFRLAKRSDGRCVFLKSDGRCRIHEEHGPAAKPLICRMFPFQLVPLDKFAYLTARRSCPSAAADRGRKLGEYRASVRKLTEHARLAPQSARPPAIVGRHRRSWNDTLRVAEGIERLMLDGRYPLVRRLVHGLQFCEAVQMCRLARLPGDELAELLSLLEGTAAEGAGEFFADRRPPDRTAQLMFRHTALEFLRLHPRFVAQESWGGRLRLAWNSLALARGRGSVPPIDADCPEATFDELERPLGHLGDAVLRPVTAYFEASAASKQYAILGRRGWSVVESFQALALAHPVLLWMLRLVSGDRAPEAEDTIGVVAAIDRGQGSALLAGRRHQRRVGHVARRGELARLVAWYAR